jgi:Carbohydrate-selective porin, OprB family/S-layer homology domain
MKPFQKLLLAPVALGLAAPVAASAADLNISGVNSYSGVSQFTLTPQDQVTSITQFSDVRPTDWAYQALSNLVERYGCVAGYPNGTFKGGQAMTRYEAAALLNACLDRVSEVTDEIKRLLGEFQQELYVIRGRVDKLESKVGKLEAQQFSTTTKLQGDTYWSIGAPAFFGVNSSRINGTQPNSATNGGTVFNYDLRLNLNTSFTGKDLLYTRLRSGNYGNSAFNGQPYSLMALDRAFGSTSAIQGSTSTQTTNNIFQLDRLYYRFPLGNQFTALIGPRARNTEFLAVQPFYYGDWEGLDYFKLNGAPGAYNKATGGMAGLIWKQPVASGKSFFAVSTSYVAPNADNSGTNAGGLFEQGSGGSWLTQLGYQANQWKATFAWRYGQCGQPANRRGTQAAVAAEPCGLTPNVGYTSQNFNNSFALGLAWQPKTSGTIVPSVSLGWGYTAYSYSNLAAPAFDTANTLVSDKGISNALDVKNIAATQSWTVGLQWKDAFIKGNSAGVAVGQPSFVTATRNGATPFDGNYAWEWWYKFQVTDKIAVTPLLFLLTNPSSAGTQGTDTTATNGGVFGGLVTAQFKF